MGIFSRKSNEGINNNQNIIRSHEFEICLNRITELNSRIAILETDLKVTQTNLDNLRGRFNQRLSKLDIEERREEKAKSENINNDTYIPFG